MTPTKKTAKKAAPRPAAKKSAAPSSTPSSPSPGLGIQDKFRTPTRGAK